MPFLHPHCELGENPLWNPDNRCLYWTDITGGRLHRYSFDEREHEIIYRGETVGGFTLQENGDLLLFRVHDIGLLSPDGAVRSVRPFKDAGSERFNDVIADPEGRVFAGTMGRTETSGGLFRLDPDGAFTLMHRGTGISNGMGFSPDLRRFYWTCSTRCRIYQFDYDRETGALSGERLFYQATPEEGIPDGMVVDRDGFIWSARWDGFALVRHAPDGQVVERVPFPVAKVSSACFGGAALDQLYITTAGGGAEIVTDDGAIFHHAPLVPGSPRFRSKIPC